MGEPNANINYVWTQLLIAELVRGGARFFFVSPGSRSAPLALAIAQHPNACLQVHFDERGSAFLALGCAKATGRPAVLVCTSGSATANYWPAIVEAAESRAPLIVLTADRPPELLECGANQAIRQTDIYGQFVRWSFTLPCPDPAIPLGVVATTAAQALYRAQASPRGPVHLNCMFREPLAPAEEAHSTRCTERTRTVGDEPAPAELHPTPGREDSKPFTTHHAPLRGLSNESLAAWEESVARAASGLLVVGQLASEAEIAAVRSLANALEWPVFPDVTSGLRLAPLRHAVHYYDLMLVSEKFRENCRPDHVLHIGGALTSKRLLQHLDRVRPRYTMLVNHPFRQDPLHILHERFEADIAEAALQLSSGLARRSSASASSPWPNLSSAASQSIEEGLAVESGLTEPGVARMVSRLAPRGNLIFLGNSMPIRDMDAFGVADGLAGRVFANRGASGVDGNIATAAGLAYGLETAVTAVVGDIAALHDINSLALLGRLKQPFVLVILNNDGGGIFSFLPIAGHAEHFEELFGTPHGLAFAHAAEMFGIEYRLPDSVVAFQSEFQAASARRCATIIEVATSRPANVQVHRRLQQRVTQAVNDSGQGR